MLDEEEAWGEGHLDRYDMVIGNMNLHWVNQLDGTLSLQDLLITTKMPAGM